MSDARSCIFCEIVNQEADASILYQDDFVTAFMDLYPVTPGHTLIVPNQHAALIGEVDEATLGKMFVLATQIDQAIRKSDLHCEAVSLHLADGAAAGQAVHHTHLHVVPRFKGDACGLHLHAGPVTMAGRYMLDEQASKLRSILTADH